MATGADKRKMAGRLGAQSLRAFLPASFMKDMRQQEAENTQLCVLWERQVNAPLVNHVRPIHYEKKTLHVNADSPAWASRARYQAREMVVRLRREKYFKDITRIEVKVKPRGGGLDRETLLKMSKPRDTQRPPAKPIPADAARLINMLAKDVTDPKLREALSRLAAARKK
ncbi:MAG: DciA family protein [Pseudomonadota bacterium]